MHLRVSRFHTANIFVILDLSIAALCANTHTTMPQHSPRSLEFDREFAIDINLAL
jgi:hypothetical protein